MNNILTFREWNQNHVKVYFDLNGSSVTVTSFDKTIFKSYKNERIQNFKNNQNGELLKLYRESFQNIQRNYTELIESTMA